ncbi:GNAT family N-acetyltransferase [Paenibacillus humicus]|uniref:GNAT family N-acetyltransferase n=1 Tax=Paenibacillus humicus TaxID=412861 RepID=UPI003F1719F3
MLRSLPSVSLRPYAKDDFYLLQLANAPDMTRYIGGPESEEKVGKRHERYLALQHHATDRMFSIVLPDGTQAGCIGYWEHVWNGESVYEMGWFTLPALQGQGIGTAALKAAIAAAASDGHFSHACAFPSISNLPSNAICRKAGLNLVGECRFEYPKGSFMTCNEWRVELGNG